MFDLNASTAALAAVEGPTDADLAAVEAVEDVTDWESLIEPVITIAPKHDEDFWAEDENVHDDRYDGSGIPSWSVWA